MHRTGQFKWRENEETFFDYENAVNSPDDELGEMRLFPDDLVGSTASATECTGLIQVAPDTKDLHEVYDGLYSYRKVEK
ncbi:MAG: hypothetical protein E7416_00840 [Ruminococcaceae bacterium]|nr:hypothetical protein [Oscillospiraceae bacterium]